MSDIRKLVDPTGELQAATRVLPPRPTSLEGLTVGLLDIAKARGDVFLDRLEERLSADGVTVRRYKKPTMTRVAPLDVKQKIAVECQVVVEGLAD